jgi:hypothetical protein
MRFRQVAFLVFLLLVVMALASGCSSPQVPSPSTTATPAAGALSVESAKTTAAVKTADIDTTVNIHYGDFDCLDVQKELGKVYLYPDEKFQLSAASPVANSANVNVNVLFVDENDQLGLRQIRPQWDAVQKKWVYEGIVPVVQFNDVTVPQEKSFTIKTQSKYYICVDDRKESGSSDIMLRVPVKLKRL